MNLDFFGISQTQLETGRDETRLCEVSRRRFRCQDVVRILILPRYLPQNLPQQRERWGAWTHVRRRGEGGDQGLILITLSPKPAQVADEEGWKHKRRLRGEIFPPPISPSSPPAHPPTYFIRRANPREGVRQLLRENFQVSRTSKFSNLPTSKASTTISTSTLDQI